jgi:hypothetical protein
MDVLNGLNNSGIDAMIVSPFNVRIDYGSRMALEFAKVVRDNRQSGRTRRSTPATMRSTWCLKMFYDHYHELRHDQQRATDADARSGSG